MSELVQHLHLKFDPFDPGSPPRDLFLGDDRQVLLNNILENLNQPGAMLAVLGELGAGKSTLVRIVTEKVGKHTQVIVIQAGLFMNCNQFMDELHAKLPDDNAANSATDLATYLTELETASKNMLLVVDDAHELASEVMEMLWELRAKHAGLAVVMLGEKQLQHLVEHSKPRKQRSEVVLLELLPLSSEDAFAYVAFKLAGAGFRQPLPLSGGELGRLYNKAAGNPAKLDALVREALSNTSVTPPLSASLAGLFAQTRAYWSVAGVLCLILAIVLLFDGSGSNSVEQSGAGNQQVRIAVPTSPTRVDSAPPEETVLVENAEPTVSAPSNDSGQDVVISDAEPRPASPAEEPPVAQVPEEPRVQQADAEPQQAPDQIVSAEPVSEALDLTLFERQVLSAPDNGYTIQVMGSRSRDSAQQFVSQRLAGRTAGVISSSFQGQPWFVVAIGVFSDRLSALGVLQELPADLREYNPWARPIAEFQEHLRSR